MKETKTKFVTTYILLALIASDSVEGKDIMLIGCEETLCVNTDYSDLSVAPMSRNMCSGKSIPIVESKTINTEETLVQSEYIKALELEISDFFTKLLEDKGFVLECSSPESKKYEVPEFKIASLNKSENEALKIELQNKINAYKCSRGDSVKDILSKLPPEQRDRAMRNFGSNLDAVNPVIVGCVVAGVVIATAGTRVVQEIVSSKVEGSSIDRDHHFDNKKFENHFMEIVKRNKDC